MSYSYQIRRKNFLDSCPSSQELNIIYTLNKEATIRYVDSLKCQMPNYNIYSTLSYYFGEGKGTPLQYSCLENSMDGGAWWAAVHGVAKSRIRLSDFTFTFHFHALDKEMATHSTILAWRIPGMGELVGLLSMGSHRVRNDWSDLAAAAAYYYTSTLFHLAPKLTWESRESVPFRKGW